MSASREERGAGMLNLMGLFNRVGPWEVVIIAVVLVFLFGAKKLPELARSIGKSARELRKGLNEDDDESDPEAG
jgi:sec-independent protein translocase protein TatA